MATPHVASAKRGAERDREPAELLGSKCWHEEERQLDDRRHDVLAQPAELRGLLACAVQTREPLAELDLGAIWRRRAIKRGRHAALRASAPSRSDATDSRSGDARASGTSPRQDAGDVEGAEDPDGARVGSSSCRGSSNRRLFLSLPHEQPAGIRPSPQRAAAKYRGPGRGSRLTLSSMAARALPAALSAVAALAFAAPAHGGWMPARAVPGSGRDVMAFPALGTGGSGRVVVGWVDDGGGSRGVRHPVVAVRVSVRRAGGGFETRTLARGRDLAAQGVTAVVDRRGEVTVAWIDARPDGHRTVRAAYRTTNGHWSAVQAIGFSSAFAYAVPRLAVAPDGRVLLSYVAGVRAAPGIGVAWRQPGHRFGALRGVGRLRIFDPVPAFDPAGRAYVSGIAQCDDEAASHGVVRLTAPGGRRFGAPVTVTPAPATELRLRVLGAGRAVAAWVGAGCSTTELLAGPIEAATMNGSTVGTRQTVYAPAGRGLVLSGASGAGAEASWTTFPPNAPGGAIFAARMTNGTFGSAAAPPGAWAAVGSDPHGDQVVLQRRPESSGPPDAAGARPAGSDVVDPAPLPAGGWVVAAGSGYGAGRALAVASFTGGALRVAAWTPSH